MKLTPNSSHPEIITLQSSPTWQIGDMEVLMAWRATVPPTTFHCTPLLYEDCRQPVGWPSLLWRSPWQILCYLANDSCRHGCVTAVGNDLIWLNLSITQAPNPMQLLENKHHMKIITSWHHAAEISSLHRHTDMADREGSDNTTTSVLALPVYAFWNVNYVPAQ